MKNLTRALRFCAVLLPLLRFPAYSQTGRFEGRTIVDIQYTAPDVLHPKDLKRAQVLRTG